MSQIFSSATATIIALTTAAFAFVVGLLTIPRLRRLAVRIGWFWLVPIGLALVVGFLVLARRIPVERLADTALPEFFRPGYWGWMFGFVVGMLAFGLVFARTYLRGRRGPLTAVSASEAADFEDLEAAWDDVLVRLSQARIDLSGQMVYLLLAPDEAAAASLIRAAGLRVFLEAPERPSPFHVFATSDGLLVTCAGVSVFGTRNGASANRLEWLMKRLLAAQPDCPLARGVTVVLPLEWCRTPDAARDTAGVRDDLELIRRTLQVRCPVYAVISGMETMPGFTELIERLTSQVSPAMADQRVGFAIPRSERLTGPLIQGGFVWMSGWLHNWILNLLAGQPFDAAVNGRLLRLDYEFRRERKRLSSLLETAFSTHPERERNLFRGCYFAATGEGPGQSAFAAGLFRGGRSRILADHICTGWSADARDSDDRLARFSWGLLAAGGLLCAVAWLAIARLTPWGYLGLALMAATWAVGLWRMRRS